MFSGWRLDGSSPMQRSDGEKLAACIFQQSSWAMHAAALGRQVVKVLDGVDADLRGPLGCSITNLHRDGRFPLEKLVRRYRFDEVNQAIDDSDTGIAIKPILMMG